MTTLTLRYFLAVAEELNVTAAAEKLYITQQTLSAHIKRLEEEYSVTLFERKPHLQLTTAGRRMVHYARRIVRLERMMSSELVDISKEKTGQLVIACSRVRAKSFLPQIWIEYRKFCPNIDIRILNDTSHNLSDFIRSHKADLCLTLHSLPEQNLVKYPLLQEKIYFLISQELFHAYFPEDTKNTFDRFTSEGVSWEELRNVPLMLLDPKNYIREVIDREFDKMDYIPRTKFETSDSETLLTMALTGCGATVLSESTVFYTSEQLISDLNKVYIFPIKGTELHSVIAAPALQELPHYQQVFVDICQQIFSQAKVKMTIREQAYAAECKFI